MNNKVLVVGGSHHNTYSLLRCFGEAGLKVDLILCGCKDSFIGHSTYIDNLWYCDDEESAYIEIVELLNNTDIRYVIISATDKGVSLLDEHYEELHDKCEFFNAGGPGVITHYMDKIVQVNEAAKAGFSVPITRSFEDGEHIYSDCFPCLIKPSASIDGGKRIAICHSLGDVEACVSQFSGVKKVLVQQYIEKDEEIVIVGVSMGGYIYIPGYIIKYRDVAGGTTYSSTAPINELDTNVTESAKRLVKDINYEGLFGIECIKSHGEYFFIEINLRNDATSYSMAVAGVNLPLMYYQFYTGERSKLTMRPVRKIYSMVEIKDFSNVLHGRVNLLSWLRQRKGAECLYYYSKYDKLPYQIACRNYVSDTLKKIARL